MKISPSRDARAELYYGSRIDTSDFRSAFFNDVSYVTHDEIDSQMKKIHKKLDRILGVTEGGILLPTARDIGRFAK
jgi:hypothetical protein